MSKELLTNSEGLTKYRFYGTLASGREAMVVALWLADITEAYRVLRRNDNLRSFKPALVGEAS